jgi:hypothetical protein
MTFEVTKMEDCAGCEAQLIQAPGEEEGTLALIVNVTTHSADKETDEGGAVYLPDANAGDKVHANARCLALYVAREWIALKQDWSE